MTRPTHPTTLWRAAAALAVLACLGCADAGKERPNVLWIVWDTVRADRMSLYGHDRPTTPNVDRWAQGARVFDDCLSTAGYTLPSHASMFTGLYASEHCTHNAHPVLDGHFTTVAELLRASGYRTFLYSANPFVSESGGLAQGFETVEHPWSPDRSQRALELVRDKLDADDRSSELADQLRDALASPGAPPPWTIKASGELAREALLDWLEAHGDRPWFAFLNYMEAHRPLIPPRAFRERTMDAADVERSYAVDRSWLATWEYTFGLRELSAEELALTRATYDAALAELDALFGELLAALDAAGALEDTVVVLTSDHGEHLGEQHMLDHQYSLYQSLLRVPLVVHFPARFAPGRDPRPVTNHDLFPTLLELGGVEPPAGGAVSLLHPLAERARFAEEPAPRRRGIDQVLAAHPGWDPSPWLAPLRTVVRGDAKLLWRAGRAPALYDLARDPLEVYDLAPDEPARAATLGTALGEWGATLEPCTPSSATGADGDALRLLKGLGY